MRSLINEGVDTVFGYPGGSIMPVFDAMYDHRTDFRQVLVRHEQGAVHAAQGYARSSGKVGVSIVQGQDVRVLWFSTLQRTHRLQWLIMSRLSSIQ